MVDIDTPLTGGGALGHRQCNRETCWKTDATTVNMRGARRWALLFTCFVLLVPALTERPSRRTSSLSPSNTKYIDISQFAADRLTDKPHHHIPDSLHSKKNTRYCPTGTYFAALACTMYIHPNVDTPSQYTLGDPAQTTVMVQNRSEDIHLETPCDLHCISSQQIQACHAAYHALYQHSTSLNNGTTDLFWNLQSYRRTSRRKRWTLDTLLKEYGSVQSPEDILQWLRSRSDCWTIPTVHPPNQREPQLQLQTWDTLEHICTQGQDKSESLHPTSTIGQTAQRSTQVHHSRALQQSRHVSIRQSQMHTTITHWTCNTSCRCSVSSCCDLQLNSHLTNRALCVLSQRAKINNHTLYCMKQCTTGFPQESITCAVTRFKTILHVVICTVWHVASFLLMTARFCGPTLLQGAVVLYIVVH